MALGLSSLLGLKGGMSWREGYMVASFRGVEFKTERTSQSGGRRIVQHEFPERDDTVNEDLGLKEKEFSISAYVVGDDYYAKRDDLEAALDQGGPGILIHPYKGEIEVSCLNHTISEQSTEGRMCRFEITFLREKDIALTIIGDSPYDKLASAKANFLEKALLQMSEIYNVVNAPNAILDDINSVAQIGLTIIDSAKTIMQIDDVFKAKLKTLQDNMTTIILSPSLVAEEFLELIDFGSDITDITMSTYTASDQGKEHFNNMKSITDFRNTNYSLFPSITDFDGEPAKELVKYISGVALGSRSGLVATMTIDHAREADQIAKELDVLIRVIEEDETIDDEYYAAIRDLRVAIRDMIVERKLDLSELIEIEQNEFEPGIALSYDLYRDMSRDLEIAKLNSILHPGFIPGRLINIEAE